LSGIFTKKLAMPTSKIEPKIWKAELENSSKFYHINGAWLAVVFDPIFGLTDYLNIPQAWQNIMVIRISISLICLISIFLYKKYQFSSFWLVLIPFQLISIQNAYTYAFLEPDNFQGHTLNYIALFIGAGLFVVWQWKYTAFVMGVSAVFNVYYFQANHQLSLKEAMVDGGLLLIVVSVFTFLLIEFRYSLTVKELKARLALQRANLELEEQKTVIEAKNQSITDSIRYASRIQKAVLGEAQTIENYFSEAMVLFLPRDIVSGDFYWYFVLPDGGKIIVVSDCTGHGVPGAFMTVLGHTYLTEIVKGQRITDPGKILLELDAKIISTLQKQTDSKLQDGMDAVVIYHKDNMLQFAGAKNPLYYFRNGEMQVIKGSSFPVGSSQFQDNKVYPTHSLECQTGDTFYLFTDGFADQFGGESNSKFMIKRFRNLLSAIATKPLSEQKVILEKEFLDWKGQKHQTDDVLVVGIRI
jgi:serine phosphatase RsbU (regulator of sigma subunit)